jgi:DNA-binding transcriptional LysR family regulator
MNLFFLKYFYDTVRLKSVTVAARENHVTQSAISQGIAQLEKSLGSSLLTHKRNSIKITPEGDAVFEWSRTIFRQIEDLKYRLKNTQNGYTGELSFACSHSLALSTLPELLMRFQKIAPSITPKILFGHTGLIKKWIKEGDVEFGFVLDNDDLSALSLEYIYKGSFRFFQSSLRPLDEPVTSCLFPPARAEVYLIKKLFLQKLGYEIKTEMEICSWEVIAKMIGMTFNVGFIPDYMAFCSSRNPAIQPCQIDLNIPYSIHAAYPLGEQLSRNAKLFLEMTKLIFCEKMKNIM